MLTARLCQAALWAAAWEEQFHGKRNCMGRVYRKRQGSTVAVGLQAEGPSGSTQASPSRIQTRGSSTSLYTARGAAPTGADQCKCGQPDDTLVRLRITAQCSAVQIIKSSASVQVPRVPPRASRLSYRPTGTRPCRRNHLNHLNRHAISITQAALIVQAPI